MAALVLRVTSSGNNQGNGNGNSDSSTSGGSSSTIYIAIAAGVGGLVLIVLIVALIWYASRRRTRSSRVALPARADVEFTNPTFMHGYLESVPGAYGRDDPDSHQYAAVAETNATYDNPAGSVGPDDTYHSLRLAPPGAVDTDADTDEPVGPQYDRASSVYGRKSAGYLDVAAVEDDA